ncbi:hypothetical protein [Clostridium vincentii]|uniref:Uncharacterized protein n=1 Tax=Clostridium vincentii TaxID=52704 RepID=A0A2T0BG53_9CLOT|nr:hypothetical protein [Clostridium vincentii]PRR82838.1 hypothetical protein CLVI_14750 [Clostridium vincentii]
MTIQLNRVHVEIRENLRAEVKDDIVSKKIQLDIDNKMKKPFVETKNDDKDKKKKFFTINGIKSNKKNIEVEAEIRHEEFKETSTGIFIDKMK